MSEQIRWLLVEGFAALFGAGVLYLALGVCYKIVGNPAPFAWSEAADSLGWLYGAMVIGIQAAVRLFGADGGMMQFLACLCVGATIFSCLLLIVAMIRRGSVPAWKPPVQLKQIAAFSAVFILGLGCVSHHVAHE